MGFEGLPSKNIEDFNPWFNWKPPTQVRVDLSFTRNLGNFESIKIGIGVDDFVRLVVVADDEPHVAALRLRDFRLGVEAELHAPHHRDALVNFLQLGMTTCSRKRWQHYC